MNKKIILALLLVSALCLSAKKDKDTINFDIHDIFASGKFQPENLYGVQMLPDGDHYAVDDYDAATKASLIVRYSFEEKKPVDTILNTAKAGLPDGFKMEEYKFSKTGRYIILEGNENHIYRHSSEAKYVVYDTKTKKVTPVFSGALVFYGDMSPDESKIGFVFKNNIYIQNLEDNSAPKQITTDGELNKIINGKTDWVYEEEFAMSQVYNWSPKGDKIAFYRFDESRVKEYEITKYDSIYPTHYRYKYPIAGEDNSEVSIWIYNLNTNAKTKLDIGEKNDQYIPRIKWTRDDNILSIQRLNRRQNDFELLFANATDFSIRKIYEEKNNTYVEITDNLYFLKDNSFLITSEAEGYNQLYLYSSSGKRIKKLTPGDFDVNNIEAVNEDDGIVYFSCQPTPINHWVFRVDLDGKYAERIDMAPPRSFLESETKPSLKDIAGYSIDYFEYHGSLSAEFSANQKYYIEHYSSSGTPPIVAIYKTDEYAYKKNYNINEFNINTYDLLRIRTLIDNKDFSEDIKKYNLPPKEFFDMPIGKGITSDAWIIKPPHMDKHKKYPVLFTIYGGPGIQTVLDGWSSQGQEIWSRWLALKGYIVVSVDNRGTGGRGAEFKKCTYKKLGQLESDDQIAAAKYMAGLPYVDAKRIGVFGWSFGGYMTSMLLTKGADVFKTGVAVAPVTDWRYYDNIYTERYMLKPSENKNGYDSTSVLTYAKMLKGNLLVVHGLFDDNVHPQNTIALLKEFIKYNKVYDSEFYPDKNHGISGGNTRLHLFTRINDYILKNL